ncbi:hypothetical protein EGJ71_16005 [Stutzerimonas stutzeri]|nr:hypothetical protein [Stutzerimonas stutzeri]MBW8452658.1 hypothetical protein [Pseudomonas sp.]RRW11221.1 hypothetical protein EGJ71_16005 [Stutzerimonas stutzeri]
MGSTLNKLIQALPWNQSIELPKQHQWKHANQHAFLEWKIKARPYNTTVANGMFICLFLFATIFFGWMGEIFNPNSSKSIAIGIPFYILTMTAIYGTTHQKTKFAYRLTETSIEVCEWKAPSKGWMIALKWLTVIAAIAVLFVIALDPSAFWIALAGPGGIGLLYLGLANSKQFQELHTSYHTYEYQWGEFKNITLDRSKKIICLEAPWLSPHSNEYVDWPFYIFSDKRNFDKHVTLIREQLKELPLKEESVSVLQF